MIESEAERVKFAKWVPQAVRDRYAEDVAAFGETRASEPLKRLLTSDGADLRAMWGRLGAKQGAAEAFFCWAHEALLGPQYEAKLPPKAHGKLERDLQAAARNLASLVKGTSLDGYLDERQRSEGQTSLVLETFFRALMHKTGDASEAAQSAQRTRVFKSFSDSLEKFADDVPLRLVPSHTDKPGNQTASRNFFARRMTVFFERYFGKVCRAHVLAATNAAFNDAPLGERDLPRIAPASRAKRPRGDS